MNARQKLERFKQRMRTKTLAGTDYQTALLQTMREECWTQQAKTALLEAIECVGSSRAPQALLDALMHDLTT